MTEGRAPRSAAEYEAEIARLRGELEALARRSGEHVAITGTLRVANGRSSLTVAGATEMILQVNGDDEVVYANAPMARLLEMPDDKKACLGTPLSMWDRAPPLNGTLQALVRVARASGQPYVLERELEALDERRLPEPSSPLGGALPVVRFVATSTAGSVQIVGQDVTHLRWLERTFSRYVPPAVIEKMQSIPSSRLLTMERREITILFADLRGFTAMAQRMEPEEVQRVVNGFLGRMVEAIERLGGTVDKFAGDEVMALFGAPIEQPTHALRALVCAAEMQRVHAEWTSKQAAAGAPAPALGVGLATGEVVVGNIGTEHRLEYTALGHPVNLAARLCGAAQGGEVLTIPATHGAALAALDRYSGEVAVPRFSFRSRGLMTFKNIGEPVEVVTVQVTR